MSRKDKRPESQPENNVAGEISDKATDRTIFNSTESGGQTRGGDEAGPNPGQMEKGPGNFTGRGVHSRQG
ncbi:MAG: hypothetical protein M3P51_09805 [Chloroflexota bacterium]|nr:hypothetical protein [Chloroflexota bacterium]